MGSLCWRLQNGPAPCYQSCPGRRVRWNSPGNECRSSPQRRATRRDRPNQNQPISRELPPTRRQHDGHAQAERHGQTNGQSIWSIKASGPGTQQLEWKVRSGRWAVVAMNADGRPGVDIDAKLGVKIADVGVPRRREAVPRTGPVDHVFTARAFSLTLAPRIASAVRRHVDGRG